MSVPQPSWVRTSARLHLALPGYHGCGVEALRAGAGICSQRCPPLLESLRYPAVAMAAPASITVESEALGLISRTRHGMNERMMAGVLETASDVRRGEDQD